MQTGDHLAWDLPIPFSHIISISISCPGLNFVINISSCKGLTLPSVSTWFPYGIHSRSPEFTFALLYNKLSSWVSFKIKGALGSFFVHILCNLNFNEFVSSYYSPSLWYSNRRPSIFNGINPRRWARFSSGIIEVFYQIVTFSIAIVGISAIIILLKAFARGASAPLKSKTISSESNFRMSIWTCFAKYFKLDGSN